MTRSTSEVVSQARRDLHNRVKRTAYIFGRARPEDGYGDNFGNDWGDPSGDLIFLVGARVDNHRIKPVGDIRGGDYMERLTETDIKLIFLVHEFSPQKLDQIVFSESEGYIVDSVEPAHGITISAICVPMEKVKITEHWNNVLRFLERNPEDVEP